jgi:hypothetical protein
MAENLDEIIDQASRLMAAGWRGNPHMSGDDRNFMSPSMRMRHDDKARAVVEFILQALRPGSTGDWVLVPKEPTEKMLWANAGSSDCHKPAWNRSMWAAFLAAAPEPPSAMLAAAGGENG